MAQKARLLKDRAIQRAFIVHSDAQTTGRVTGAWSMLSRGWSQFLGMEHEIDSVKNTRPSTAPLQKLWLFSRIS